MWRYTIREMNSYMELLNKEAKSSKGSQGMSVDEFLNGRSEVFG